MTLVRTVAHYNSFIDVELNTQMIRGKLWARDIVR